MAGSFQLLGTIAGSYFGPIGGAIGGAVGGLIDQEVFGKTLKGPRLDTFRTTGSEVGAPMIRGYGNNRIAGELMWFGRIRERKRTKTSGGIGGFGGQKTTTYEYYATFAIALMEGEAKCLRSIRLNGKMWYQDPGYANGNENYLDQQARLIEFGPDALTATELAEYNTAAAQVAKSQANQENFTFYRGTPDQSVDPTIQAYLGDATPAYRDTAYVVFNELPVTEYGGALPLIEFEVVSGDTVSGETLNIWVAKELNPWIEGSSDPRHPLNDHQFRKIGGTFKPTLEEAIADAEAAISATLSDTLIGWSTTFSDAGLRSVSPYTALDTAELTSLYLHFNRYTDLVSEDRFFGTLEPGTGDVCGAINVSGITPGSDYFWWQFKLSDGNTPTGWSGTALSGVYQYSIRYTGDIFDPPLLSGTSVSNNCTAYPPPPGDTFPLWAGYNDTFIEIQRLPGCPAPLCESGVPLPENPDYCVIDGNIYPEVTYAETTDGTFLQLALFTDFGGSVTQYPLGPVLNLDYAPHVANNTEEWWEPHYLAAVEAGTAEAGWTFDATGTGGAGTYPRIVSEVCQVVISSPSYCAAEAVYVADIIEVECLRRGLTVNDIDTSQVTDTIWGYKLERNVTGRDAIEQLRTFSWLDAPEVDGLIRFIPRGLDAVATLTSDDMAAHEYGQQRPPAVEVTRVDDIQLPRTVRVSYSDQDADFQPGQQYDRRLVTDAVNTQDIQLGITMSGDRAKKIATIALYDQWAARKAMQISLGPKFLALCPGDVVWVPDLEDYTRSRIESIDLSIPGLQTLSLVRDEQSLYDREATGPSPQVPDEQTNDVQGPTTTVILDLPAMSTNDDDAGYYVAMYGVLDGWQSATGFRSLDGGSNYDEVVEETGVIAGKVTVPYDGAEMTVQVYGGELLNATTAATLAGTNRFAVGVSGRWVIGTFETATDLGGGIYTLSDLNVGLFDTAWAIGPEGSPSEFLSQAGDDFVMLETVMHVSENDDVVGTEVIFRPVTAGTAFDNAPSIEFTARGNGRGFVTGFGTTTPPTHDAGATYVAGIGATGEWFGYDDYIVHDVDDTWYFELPENGRQVRTTAGTTYQYTSGSPGFWVLVPTAVDEAEAREDADQDLQDQIDAITQSAFMPDDILTDGDAVLVDHNGNVLTT